MKTIASFRPATLAALLALALGAGAGAARAGSQILWGIGDNLDGSPGRRLEDDVPLGLASIWYQGPGDINGMRAFRDDPAKAARLNALYAAGKGLQVIVWLANHRDYAIGAQFQADIAEAAACLAGTGPATGPVYFVLFTELETYAPADSAAAETYKTALKDAFIAATTAIHTANENACVGLGFGGYSWPKTVPDTRNLDRWADAIAASDFTCTQQMQSYKHVDELPGKLRNSVSQLGAYGKPVMISHFKIWSGGADASPDPLYKKINDAKAAFATFMTDVFTDASLDALVADGLWAWVFMDDFYIRDNTHLTHLDTAGKTDISGLDNTAYTTASAFVAAHNTTSPALPSSTPGGGGGGGAEEMLAEFNFDNMANAATSPFAATGTGANILTVSALAKGGSLDLFAYTEEENPGGVASGTTVSGIRGHGSAGSIGPSQNEGGARTQNMYVSFTVTPASGNTLFPSKLTFDLQGHTGAIPSNPLDLPFYIQICTDKGGWAAANKIGDTISVSTPTTANTYTSWTKKEVDLSALTLAADEPLEVRLYFWRSTAAVNDRTTRFIEIDNLKLHGTATDGSPPPVNQPPVIETAPGNQLLAIDTPSGLLDITISDPDSDPSALSLAAISSNDELIPSLDTDALAVVGSGSTWTLTITPAAGKSGVANITLVASDGEKSASTTFSVTVFDPANPDQTLPLVAYNFDGMAATAGTGAAFAPTTVAGLVTTTDLTQGAGISFNVITTAGAGNPAPALWENCNAGATDIGAGTAAAAITGNDYLEFTVTPGPGEALSLHNLTLDLRARLTNVRGVTTFYGALYSSLDNYQLPVGVGGGTAEVSVAGIVTNDDAPAPAESFTGDWETKTFPLAALAPAPLRDQPVTFRLYFWRTIAQSTGGNNFTGGMDARQLDLDNIVLHGITVIPPNSPPSITVPADQTIAAGTGAGPLPITLDDDKTAPAALVLTATSSNPALLPATGITLAGAGAARTITLAPVAGQGGVATISLAVTDDDPDLPLTTRASFNLVVVKPGEPLPLVSYSFENPAAPLSPDAAVNLTATPVSGGGFTADASGATGHARVISAPQGTGDSAARAKTEEAALGTNNSLAFTLTPPPGQALRLHTLAFNYTAGILATANHPTKFYVAACTSEGGFVAGQRLGDPVMLEVNAPTANNAEDRLGAWTPVTINLSALAPAVDEPVEIRLYFWLETNATGGMTKRIVSVDDITVTGLLETAGPSEPVTGAGTGVTDISFTATWTPSADRAVWYSIDVATDPDFNTLVLDNADAGRGASFTVTGLTAANTYYYRVRAHNNAGAVVSNTVQTVTTAAHNPPPQITAAIADQSILAGDGTTGPLPFTATDTDSGGANADAALAPSARSDNPAHLPPDAPATFVFAGAGAGRTLTVNPAPGVTGTARVTVVVADAFGATASTTFTLTVSPGSRWPDVTTEPRAIFTANVPSSFAVQCTGIPPFTFSAENLPDGLAIDPVTGLISGTLSTPGTHTFTILVENDNSAAHGGPTRQTFTVTVEDAPAITAGLAGAADPVTIVTLAGLAGEEGDAVDRVVSGSDARFRLPIGVAVGDIVGANDAIFVADTYNHAIRVVRVSGLVETIAGQSGTAGNADGAFADATFNHPTGLALRYVSGTTEDFSDYSLSLYVADTDNHTIRKLAFDITGTTGDGKPAYSLHSGTVTTFAGQSGEADFADGYGSNARFNHPQGLWVTSGTNRLFVADTDNHVIRRIELDTSQVALYAGKPGIAGDDDVKASGNAGGSGLDATFNSPVGVASNGDATRIWVADTGNHTIRQVSARPDESVVITLAGLAGNAGVRNGTGTEARFSSPSAISWVYYKETAYLYVLDGAAHTIRQIPVTGARVTSVAGLAGVSGDADGKGDQARFYLPQGIVADSLTSSVRLHIADTGNHTIRRTLPLPVITGVVSTPEWTAAGTNAAGYSRQIVTPGTDVTFTVTATTFNPLPIGTGAGETEDGLAYQWWLGGRPIPGATEPAISIPGVTVNTAGIYTLRVTDALGTTTHNVSIGLTSGVETGHGGFEGSYSGGSGGGAPSAWLLPGMALLIALRRRRQSQN
jgi:hypothetical protein